MKKINLTDNEFFDTKARELAELSEAFEKVSDDIIARDEYYTKKGFGNTIPLRQDCLAVSYALAAAHSAMLNILNKSTNIPSNAKKLMDKKASKKLNK